MIDTSFTPPPSGVYAHYNSYTSTIGVPTATTIPTVPAVTYRAPDIIHITDRVYETEASPVMTLATTQPVVSTVVTRECSIVDVHTSGSRVVYFQRCRSQCSGYPGDNPQSRGGDGVYQNIKTTLTRPHHSIHTSSHESPTSKFGALLHQWATLQAWLVWLDLGVHNGTCVSRVVGLHSSQP
ncbi:hypothetical protein BDV96DRAFT_575697 [Lophiotrema nucula]|uniref:Uncharacterized protein n=1 Tax=Lophiotrema nucula TaxID=690887 RepID=A0A6A5Z9F8_9PLEO|nr:hypothetical protein BDV96DRAFT_575697 [Lophiotrema nucula]